MSGLKMKKYLQITRKRFDPLALALSSVGLVAVLFSVGTLDVKHNFVDPRSFILIFGGTFASLLFQFDFSSVFYCLAIIARSFLGTPNKRTLLTIKQLDEAILSERKLADLRSGREINGDLLNDVVFMHRKGLLIEEIDEFLASRINDECHGRKVAVSILRRAATISPALGLFGTVVGLIGVLKTLSNPQAIGPSMSLALMTTAYGAGLSSLIFTPLAGRLEHHNDIYLEVHKQIMSKIAILLNREERKMEVGAQPQLRSVG